MPVTRDILRTWRGPRAVIRDLLAMGQREDRAIAYLLAGCGLIFVAQWPRLARVSFLEGQEFDRLIAYELLSWLIIWPLAFYLIAGLLFLALRAVSSTIRPYDVRLAVFWSLLASAPLGLLYGLMTGFIGPGPGANLVGALWLAALAVFLVQSLREACSGSHDQA